MVHGESSPTIPARSPWRRAGYLLLIALGLYIADQCFIRSLWNPIRRSKESIEADLLEHIPVGTSAEDVAASVRARGYSFGKSGGRGLILLGSYESFGFLAVVNADCYFTSDGRLISIHVYKAYKP